MKLIGYIQAIKENSFAIPIYFDGVSFFFHEVNDHFKIISFHKAYFNESQLFKIYLSKNFELGSTGSVVFVGKENYILFNSADVVINEIISYLSDNTNDDEYIYIKKEANTLMESIANNIVESISSKVFGIHHGGSYNLGTMIKPLNENDIDLQATFDYIHNLEILIKERYLSIENSPTNIHDETIKYFFGEYFTKSKLLWNLMIERLVSINGINDIPHNQYMLFAPQNPPETTIEETLYLKGLKRRSELKSFNHQFHGKLAYYEIPAYKRFGIDVTSMPALENNFSKIVWQIGTNMTTEGSKTEDIKNQELTKKETKK
ncbi:hypothetical protein L1S35_03920 [Flavobacterium sp. AS60]|uniref:hypothetical protein n=1 Tax=Flavobacterium anseongense TaxID=2910677 RepID=UPI001F25CE20|nr:hypothetical protein [Flavobacterium sp. AS60]MCF6128805.1 hypothetical protein [Flavobacterium sp. AS60]